MDLISRDKWFIAAAGLAMGVLGVFLSIWGNPDNSGICVSCFIENTAGALGLHDNARLQYIRPELSGFVLGSFLSALIAREFRAHGGSAPMLRLFGGVFLIVGCAIFIGCPIKLLLRLSAGDLTAVAGFAGLAVGVWAGIKVSERGVDLGGKARERSINGLLIPGFFLLLLAFSILKPAFIIASTEGSSSQHAPFYLSLGSGLILGVLAQRSRFCITGSTRDIILMGRRAPQLIGFTLFIGSAILLSLATGRFHLSLYGQPGAHTDHLWSFLGMGLVGWISVLIGGCPFRQLVKSGEGDTDAGMSTIGMLLGGAVVQSWGLTATASGVPIAGKMALLAGFAFILLATLLYRERSSQ